MNDRQHQKQASREQDDHDLKSGAVSAEELRRRNAHFAGLNVRIAWERLKRLY